ncbi:MAG: isocitrate lyase/phosphoenolpyruvate mutase family protein [Pseudomonadota bacterium]
MTQLEKANVFKALHKKGEPLILYNIWDAGGAKALSDAGARAIATGSWSLAAAHGFQDGENIPLDLVLTLVERITHTVELPVSVDFEGGYALAPDAVAENVRRVIRAGAIGINFEDRIVDGEGLHSILSQCDRIRAIRTVAREESVPLFVNARTDLFLGTERDTHPDRVSEAVERGAAYAEAGADGFFVPGLVDTDLIGRIVDAVRLPVNVMMFDELTSIEAVASLGVSRASYGPGPYLSALSDLVERFKHTGEAR